MFGLTNSEGNHGEDVKEYYFYLDSTPTHSYLSCLYKYPQAEYPYDGPGRDEPARGAGPTRVRAARHRRLRRRPLLRRGGRVRQGGARGPAGPGHRPQPRAGRRRRCTCCRRCCSATPGRGGWTGRSPPARARRPARHRGRARRPRHPPALLRRRRPAAVHRERDQHRAALRRARPPPRSSRTGSTGSSSAARPAR